MYLYFHDHEFEQWLLEKDYSSLKTAVINVIRNDPTFSSGEFDKVIAVLEQRCPEIFDEYQLQNGEEAFDASGKAWSNEYFRSLTFWFRENFALSRKANIEKVGKKLYGSKTTENFTQPPKLHPKESHPPKKRNIVPLVLGSIVALVALVAIIVKLLK